MIPEIELRPHPITGELVLEEWVEIPNYEGLYNVSNYGRIMALASKKGSGPRIIKGSLDSRGYPHIQLFKLGHKMMCFKKHLLVARLFIPNPLNKPTVNHKKGIKTDSFYLELEWATHKENINHAIDSGLRTRDQNLRPLTPWKQTPQLLEAIRIGRISQSDIARKFKVSPSLVCTLKKKLQLS